MYTIISQTVAQVQWTQRQPRSTLTHSQGIKESVNGSLVFYNPRLLDTFHKLLQLHVFLRQLKVLHATFLISIAMAGTFTLMVPLNPADEPLEL